MQYKEFETRVITLLRSRRLAEALALISQHKTSFAGADRCDYLSLKATVKLEASAVNAAVCADLVDEVMSNPETRPLTKLRMSFLGALLAVELDEPEAWRSCVAKMFEYLPADERFRGRALRGKADYKAEHASSAEAIDAYEAALVWHLSNTGPYDERDRLCYLGLVCTDLVPLLLGEGRVTEAVAAVDTARTSIPEDAFQRVYVPISDAHIGLAADDLAKAEAAVNDAGSILALYPNGYADRQLDRLRVMLLQKQGRNDQAQAIVDRMIARDGRLRNLASLRSSQALSIQTG